MQYSSEAFLLAYVALLTIVAWLGVAILYLMAVSGRSRPAVIVNNFLGSEEEEEEEQAPESDTDSPPNFDNESDSDCSPKSEDEKDE